MSNYFVFSLNAVKRQIQAIIRYELNQELMPAKIINLSNVKINKINRFCVK